MSAAQGQLPSEFKLGQDATLADGAAELYALIEAGGFWRLAPDWVPRGGYVSTPRVLAAVATRLRRKL
ncbi:hypothetical protein ACX6XY_11470 [Streptomyces sp. O3]